MTKKKKKDPHAEKVESGVQPKRGPRGSQSAEMNWLSARMESHPSSSQSRLRRALGTRAYKKLSSRPNDPSPVEAARKRRENASTDYSKLHFLGRFLAEYRIRRRKKDAPGQTVMKFPEATPKRRKKAAVPRRRKGDEDSKGRAIDQPTGRRKRGFRKETGGTRKGDVGIQAKREADEAAAAAKAARKSAGRGKRYGSVAKGYAGYRLVKSIGPKGRRRPSGTNVRTGGTEGTVKL